MKDDAKTERRREIEAAAYALVEEKGYGGTSMLAIARRARASNETLYNWYGDKLGLFKTLVTSNAESARNVLQGSLKNRAGFDDDLLKFGTVLLQTVLGSRAVALNKAAAADPTGELGEVLAHSGRDVIFPLLQQVFTLEISRRVTWSVEDITQTYLSLLIADRQIRRVIGCLSEPTEKECSEVSQSALHKIRHLLNA